MLVFMAPSLLYRGDLGIVFLLGLTAIIIFHAINLFSDKGVWLPFYPQWQGEEIEEVPDTIEDT
ncbi:MAG: hypothetical protein NVSMB31_02510 [Vulcanimicrobiaceae bacterium]